MGRRTFSVAFLLSLLVVLVLTGCGAQATPTPEAKAAKAAFVLHGTRDDGTWNAMAWEGKERLEEMGFETTSSESVDDADVARVMRNYASEGYDLIWAHSGTYPNAVMEVAADFPETSFAVPTGPGLEFPDNVWEVTHEWEDAYYLAGAMAGMMTESGVVGQVGGIPIPIYVASMTAFNQGVESMNPGATTFDPVFVGDFNDSVAAKQATQAQIEAGADIILSSMDAGVFGMIEAAREANAAGGNVRIMTILSDLYDQAPEVVLSSAYMDYPGAVTAVATEVTGGELGGYFPMNWAEGNARWADLHGQVPDDVLEKLAEIEKQIVAGELDIFTQADLNQ
jgi:basic membrane protein A